MPVSTPHPRRRRRLAVGICALVAVGAFTFAGLGRFMAREVPKLIAYAIGFGT